MQKRNRIIGAIAGGVLALSGGGAATAFGLSNEVSIDVYGETNTIRTFDSNVESILDKEGVKIQKIDKVTPALNQQITDGETIIVEKLNVFNITVNDKKPQQFTTELNTVGEIVENAGYKLDEVKVSPSAETVLEPGKALDITVETPKTVTFKGKNGILVADDVFVDTVGQAAEKYLGDYNPETDKLEPAADTELKHGMTIDITRVRTAERTETEPVKFKKVEKEDDTMFVGEEKITTKGVDGVKTITLKDKLVDGKVSETEKVKEEITKKPVDEVLSKGTKEKPAPAPVVEEETVEENSQKATSKSENKASKSEAKAPSTNAASGSTKEERNSSSKSSRNSQRSAAPASQSSGSGSGLLAGIPQSKIAQFDRLAQCESSGNWSISTGMFEGGVQFLNSTWLAYGGGEFAPHAYQATREEQIYVANKLQNVTGWRSSWPGCSKKFGW